MPETSGNAPFFVDREVIILTRDGVWLADGTEISHEPTRRLFARSLKRDAAGYFLSIGRETKRITVEDTAYFVIRIEGSTAAGFEILLSDESRERLAPETLAYRPGRLVCQVKSNSEPAKFLRAPYYDLLRSLEEDERGYFLTLQGMRYQLGSK